MSSITEKAIPGGWAEKVVTIAGRRFSLALPQDPDAVLLAMGDNSDSDRPEFEPYWAHLWSAAAATAEVVLRRAPWPIGTRVLEIGCGIGVTGLAALARGYEVTFSDYVEDAVTLAVENARRNGFQSVFGETIDWRSPPSRQFPVIVGSDLLYDTDHHEAIFQTLNTLLEPNGVCWLGDSGRNPSRQFIRLASQRGFRLELWNATGDRLSIPTTRQFQLLVLQKTAETGSGNVRI